MMPGQLWVSNICIGGVTKVSWLYKTSREKILLKIEKWSHLVDKNIINIRDSTSRDCVLYVYFAHSLLKTCFLADCFTCVKPGVHLSEGISEWVMILIWNVFRFWLLKLWDDPKESGCLNMCCCCCCCRCCVSSPLQSHSSLAPTRTLVLPSLPWRSSSPVSSQWDLSLCLRCVTGCQAEATGCQAEATYVVVSKAK